MMCVRAYLPQCVHVDQRTILYAGSDLSPHQRMGFTDQTQASDFPSKCILSKKKEKNFFWKIKFRVNYYNFTVINYSNNVNRKS